MKKRTIPFDGARPLDAEPPPPPQFAPPGAGNPWVFAYGSLMWAPEFPHLATRRATLHGYHRAFCVWSHHYRGTRLDPGLVLGLAPGGSCVGRAIQIARADWPVVLDYLYRREMLTGCYLPKFVRIRMPKRQVAALAFVVDRAHQEYTGRLGEDQIVAVIGKSHGRRGSGRDYLGETVRHLDELGIADGPLHHLWRRVAGKGGG
jgi:cation transport protein ChaC